LNLVTVFDLRPEPREAPGAGSSRMPCQAQPTDPTPSQTYSMALNKQLSLVVELNAGELLKHGQPAAPSTLYRPVLTVTPEELGFGKGIVKRGAHRHSALVKTPRSTNAKTSNYRTNCSHDDRLFLTEVSRRETYELSCETN
jgi:hypothetical protein